jgi:hypothetical protein
MGRFDCSTMESYEYVFCDIFVICTKRHLFFHILLLFAENLIFKSLQYKVRGDNLMICQSPILTRVIVLCSRV